MDPVEHDQAVPGEATTDVASVEKEYMEARRDLHAKQVVSQQAYTAAQKAGQEADAANTRLRVADENLVAAYKKAGK